MAIGRQHLEVARLLLESGANPNRRDGFGRVPLDRATTPDAVALLRQFGASESLKWKAPEVSPVNAAWALLDKGDDAEVLRALFARGLDPNAVQNGQSLLERALFRQRAKMVRLLADTGARLHIPDSRPARFKDWDVT